MRSKHVLSIRNIESKECALTTLGRNALELGVDGTRTGTICKAAPPARILAAFKFG